MIMRTSFYYKPNKAAIKSAENTLKAIDAIDKYDG